MKFRFEQRWAAPAAEVVDIYTDEGFWSGLDTLSATSAPEVLSITNDGTQAVVSLHYRLAVDLPGDASRFIDPGNVAWTEETTWDLRAMSAIVRFLPDQAARLIRANAHTSLAEIGGEAVRVVDGNLKVNIPLLGSRIERAIVEGVERHLDEEAAAVRTGLA